MVAGNDGSPYVVGVLNVTYRVENGNEASVTWYNREQDQHAVCIHMKVEWE